VVQAASIAAEHAHHESTALGDGINAGFTSVAASVASLQTIIQGVAPAAATATARAAEVEARAARLASLGRAVQVDPVKPVLKPPGIKHLELKYDVLLSTFAFTFNLRRYPWAPTVWRCWPTACPPTWPPSPPATR